MISVKLLKIGKHSWFSSQLLSNGRWKTGFHSCHKTVKSFWEFIRLWGTLSQQLSDVCMDFEPCFKVYNLVSVYPKSIKLCQMTTPNVIFHAVVSVYRSVKNRSSSMHKFWNGWFIKRNFFILQNKQKIFILFTFFKHVKYSSRKW